MPSRTLLAAFVIGCCLVDSLAFDIVGHWSPNHCVTHQWGSEREILRLSGATASMERIMYSDQECTEKHRLWTRTTFGHYYNKGKPANARALFYGSNTVATSDAEQFVFGISKLMITPNSLRGEHMLNGIVSQASTSDCESKPSLDFQHGDGMDVTLMSCPALHINPVWNCSNIHFLVYKDASVHPARLYMAHEDNPCDIDAPSAGVFNHDNCDGSLPGCDAHEGWTQVLPPNLAGVWESECLPFNGTTSDGTYYDIASHFEMTVSGGRFSTVGKIYSGNTCTGAEFVRDYEYGKIQVGPPSHSYNPPRYLVDFAAQTRALMSPTEASVNVLNSIIQSDAQCRTELRNITAGEFKPTTFSTCMPLGIMSLGKCPTHYSTVRFSNPTHHTTNGTHHAADMVYIALAERTDERCSPGPPTPEFALLRKTVAHGSMGDYLDFGTSMPVNLFDSGAQGKVSAFYYYMSMVNEDYTELENLVQDDFHVIVRGHPNFNPLAGVYRDNLMFGQKHGALKALRKLWSQHLKLLSFSDLEILGSSPAHVIITYKMAVESLDTGAVISDLEVMDVLHFHDGLIEKIVSNMDSMAMAILECPESIRCGGGGRMYHTTIHGGDVSTTTNTVTNSHTVYNSTAWYGGFTIVDNTQYGAQPQPQQQSQVQIRTKSQDMNSNAIIGVTGILMVVVLVLIIMVLSLLRSVSALRDGAALGSHRHEDTELSSIPVARAGATVI